ncbi:MAG TPA: lysophospholipid acyltransferase family protein [Candidatus Polarisedimenticolia bacterium]|jgi:1-acyl-sn-glycerol-3-phosphate acyltransferase|nr:lysophospholipid acyltransferase family protein [Candidatus Polarisedimenticolia bacterium]
MLNLVRISLIVLVTAIAGSLGILSCLVLPSGDGVLALARVWARLVLGLCGVRVVVEGRDKIRPPGPYVFLSNHQSQFDIPAAVLAIPIQFRILAKQELFHIPIFGWALRLSGFVAIDRRNRDKAIASLDRAAERIRRGRSLLIFAEGTRSPDGRLLPFKKGAFVLAIQAGVPVVPLAIRGSRAVLPKGSLSIRPGIITVVVGDPIDPRPFSVDQKEALMTRVRSALEAALGAGTAA